MARPTKPHIARPAAPPPVARLAAAATVQRAGAAKTFAPNARAVRPPAPPQGVPEELISGPGDWFHVRSAQHHTLSPPSGTFNFVKVYGETPRSRPVLISAKLPHAQLAAGRPVVYAGTTCFESGKMAWWSNYSGTYQPIAAFRAQAGLPEDKFVPWQKLQMGGVSMQRGTFVERRAAAPKPAPAAAPEAKAAASPGSDTITPPTAPARGPTTGGSGS